MHDGQLTQRQFQGWVANRLAYQRAVPRKDAAILSNCPDPDVRREWLQRIVDHDGTEPGTGGIEMWIRLGEALGVPREEMEDERHVLPAARLDLRGVRHLLQDQAVGRGRRLVAHRAVRARIHAAAHRGVPPALPLDPPGGARLLQEPADPGARATCSHGLSIVQPHCTTVETQRGAFEALAFKLEMLWAMIDTIHHALPRRLGRGDEPAETRCPRSGGSRASTSTRCATSPCCSTPRAPCCSTTPARRSWSCATAGARSREIAGILGERYQTDVTADVIEYLSHLAERELIRDA